jgi:hypothetical protein
MKLYHRIHIANTRQNVVSHTIESASQVPGKMLYLITRQTKTGILLVVVVGILVILVIVVIGGWMLEAGSCMVVVVVVVFDIESSKACCNQCCGVGGGICSIGCCGGGGIWTGCREETLLTHYLLAHSAVLLFSQI